MILIYIDININSDFGEVAKQLNRFKLYIMTLILGKNNILEGMKDYNTFSSIQF